MTGVPPGEPGPFVHQAVIYRSDAEFVATVAPFLRAGAARAQPTLVSVATHETQLLRGALGDLEGVIFLPEGGYGNPLLALRDNRTLLTRYTRSGPARLVGQVPEAQLTENWTGWARYESAVAQVLAALPVQTLCAYDACRTPPGVLRDVTLAHPRVATGGLPPTDNAEFVDADSLLAEHLRGQTDPLERDTPAVTLTGPTPQAARTAIAAIGRRADLTDSDVDGLKLAVSEVVANAHGHGRPPVQLTAWWVPGRVVVTVTDSGAGPSSTSAGMAPRSDELQWGGFGLWLAHQMCTRVDHWRHPGGFTVRLTAAA